MHELLEPSPQLDVRLTSPTLYWRLLLPQAQAAANVLKPPPSQPSHSESRRRLTETRRVFALLPSRLSSLLSHLASDRHLSSSSCFRFRSINLGPTLVRNSKAR